MPYQIVKLPAGAQTGLVRIVREQIDPLLRDVHAMLMLPRKDIPGLDAGCNLAVSLVLLNVVSGVSATLYDDPSLGDVDPRNQSGEAFRRVLERHYPWDEEPNVEGAIRERHAATVFYDAFRNPLTHRLGIVLPDEDHGHGQRKVAKGAMSDKKIEDIETSEPRPLRWSRPTPSTDGSKKADRTKTDMDVKQFYAGVRRMIWRVIEARATSDAPLRGETYPIFPTAPTAVSSLGFLDGGSPE